MCACMCICPHAYVYMCLCTFAHFNLILLLFAYECCFYICFFVCMCLLHGLSMAVLLVPIESPFSLLCYLFHWPSHFCILVSDHVYSCVDLLYALVPVPISVLPHSLVCYYLCSLECVFLSFYICTNVPELVSMLIHLSWFAAFCQSLSVCCSVLLLIFSLVSTFIFLF